MKRIICDHCRAEVEPDNYGSAPLGWISVTRRETQYLSKDFCTPTCAIEGVQEMLDADLAANKPVEAL